MIVFPVIVNSQEIKIASSVLASGGNVIAGNNITLSKWRIGVVHQLTLNVMQNETPLITNGQIAVYPNPVVDLLHFRFSFPEKQDYIIEISDNLGKKLLSTIIHQIAFGDVVQMDLSSLTKGLYVVVIRNTDKTSYTNFKIIKN